MILILVLFVYVLGFFSVGVITCYEHCLCHISATCIDLLQGPNISESLYVSGYNGVSNVTYMYYNVIMNVFMIHYNSD